MSLSPRVLKRQPPVPCPHLSSHFSLSALPRKSSRWRRPDGKGEGERGKIINASTQYIVASPQREGFIQALRSEALKISARAAGLPQTRVEASPRPAKYLSACPVGHIYVCTMRVPCRERGEAGRRAGRRLSGTGRTGSDQRETTGQPPRRSGSSMVPGEASHSGRFRRSRVGGWRCTLYIVSMCLPGHTSDRWKKSSRLDGVTNTASACFSLPFLRHRVFGNTTRLLLSPLLLP